ncbi:MAG: hypothetical protein ACRDCN_13690 [Tannerellaceae bacterium]
MKKSLFNLLTLICAVLTFSACSDDDKPNYNGTYESDKLKLTLNGADVTNKAVILSETAIDLESIIVGENNLSVPVTFEGNKFTGINNTTDRAITVDGTIENQVLTLSVTLKMTSPLVGTWNIFDGNISLQLEAPEGTMLSFMGTEMPASQFEMLLPILMGSVPQAYLKDVTFNENGFITAHYDPTGQAGKNGWVESPATAMNWYVKDNQVYLVPNLAAMVSSSKTDSNDILLDILKNGLPLNFSFTDLESGEKQLLAYVTKDQMLPMMDIIIELVDGLDPNSNPMLGMVKTILPEFKEALTVCTKFDLGMKLNADK